MLILKCCGALVVATLISCEPSESVSAINLQTAALSPTASFVSTDQEFKYLATVIPGFGGMFLGNGRLYVHLKDPATQTEARTVLDRHLLATAPIIWARLSKLTDRYVFDVGKYSFDELLSWKRLLAPKLSSGALVYVDADERANRVRVGVGNDVPDGREWAARVIQFAGVPTEAVIIDVVPPAQLASELTDSVRPVIGGLQIFGPYTCTLGLNISGGEFLTASHCTETLGVVDSTSYYQGNELIGIESRDPAFQQGGSCESGWLCRDSDVAAFAYESGITKSYGIAKTEGFNSLEITGSYWVGGTVSYVYNGDELNKVGRTTGGTWGNVTLTCADTYYSAQGVKLYCQTYVEAAKAGGSYLGPLVNSGDSGAPVFSIVSSSEAAFYGILNGMSSVYVGIFSPVANIEGELGTLYVN